MAIVNQNESLALKLVERGSILTQKFESLRLFLEWKGARRFSQKLEANEISFLFRRVLLKLIHPP